MWAGWHDDGCVAILRNCRAALDDAGRLLIIELVLPQHDDAKRHHALRCLLDLIMLQSSLGARPRDGRHGARELPRLTQAAIGPARAVGRHSGRRCPRSARRRSLGLEDEDLPVGHWRPALSSPAVRTRVHKQGRRPASDARRGRSLS
jgi:O-methyltransferase